MKRNILLLTLTLLVSACDQLGSTKIKNLIDLTPPLRADSSIAPNITHVSSKPFNYGKKMSRIIAKNNIISQPEIVKNTVYSSDDKGFITAFSLTENKKLWQKNIKGDILDRSFIGGGILYNDGKLYVTNGTRYLIVLDAVTGIEEFRKEFSDIIRVKPIMASNNRLLIQTVSNKLYVIDSNSFKIFWAHEGGLKTISSSNHAHPTLFKDKVIVSYSSGEIFALELQNGGIVWRYTLTAQDNVSLPGFVPSTVQTQPIISDDFMYFASSNDKLVKLYLYTGLPVWTKKLYDIQTLTLHEQVLIVTNNARQVATINAENADISWVGNLISKADRSKKKTKTALFLAPFLSVKDGVYAINVAADNGELYSFVADESSTGSSSTSLPEWPKIEKITKKPKYQWMSPSNGLIYFITDRKIYN